MTDSRSRENASGWTPEAIRIHLAVVLSLNR